MAVKDKGFSGRVVYIEKCYRVVDRGAIRALCATDKEAFDRARQYAEKRGSDYLIKVADEN